MKILLLKTLRDLRATLAQSVALIVIVMLGVASFAATVAAYRDLDTSYNRTYEDLRFADVTFAVQGAPESIVEEILVLEGVRNATGRLVIDTGMELPERDGETTDPIRGRLIGLPVPERPQVNDVLILEGRYFNSTDETSILADTHFAEYFHLGSGDAVSPLLNGRPVEFQIIGVAASPEYLMASPSRQELIPSARSFGVFFLPLEVLQKHLGLEGKINDIAIRLENGADEQTVVRRVQEKLASFGLSATTLRADQPSHANLTADVNQFRDVAYLLPSVILLVAAISVYMMLGRHVRAQTPQIGLMKALGYADSAVTGHYLSYALVIGLIGSAAGALLGLPLGSWITKMYAAELGIPIIQTQFYPDLILEGAALSLAATVLAGFAPARGAARQTPAQAMRFDPAIAQVKGRVSFLERVIHLPLELRLPIRNIFRVRRRSLTTALGIIFAYILILMVWGLRDSIEIMVSRNYETVERWDISVSFASLQTDSTGRDIRGWSGVQAAEPVLQIPVTLRTDTRSEEILLTAFDPGQTMHALQLPGGITPREAFAGGRLLISTGLADLLDLSEGDRVTLDTAFGPQEFTLGPTTDEMMNAVGYLPLDEIQKRMGTPALPYNGLWLDVDDSQSRRIKTDLYRLPGTAGVLRKSDLVADIRGYMGLFYLLIGIMMAVAITMAFALLFNAMMVTVLERKREFATMRSIGSEIRRIAMLLVTENLLLWLLTLAPGLLLGHWMALQVGTAFSVDLFTFRIVLAPSTYVFTAAGIFLTMILATLPAIRRVSNLNLAEATKVMN
ncbi:MAG: ABC transporter permease [Anaerolineales bacterium]|nr:ABC transporter permease [Anaerolineales bacterium]